MRLDNQAGQASRLAGALARAKAPVTDQERSDILALLR